MPVPLLALDLTNNLQVLL